MDLQADRYFEDYIVGQAEEVGNVSLSEAEIIDFALKYDPQDFHIDPEKVVLLRMHNNCRQTINILEVLVIGNQIGATFQRMRGYP